MPSSSRARDERPSQPTPWFTPISVWPTLSPWRECRYGLTGSFRSGALTSPSGGAHQSGVTSSSAPIFHTPHGGPGSFDADSTYGARSPAQFAPPVTAVLL